MEVKCTKGFWNVKPENGEICSGLCNIPLAKVYGPSSIDKKDRSSDEYISNAAVMTEAANMYYLLLFIKAVLEILYWQSPATKGVIWEYVEGRIAMIEKNIQEIIEHRPDKS